MKLMRHARGALPDRHHAVLVHATRKCVTCGTAPEKYACMPCEIRVAYGNRGERCRYYMSADVAARFWPMRLAIAYLCRP